MPRILIDPETKEEFEVVPYDGFYAAGGHLLNTVVKREPEPREFEEVDKAINEFLSGGLACAVGGAIMNWKIIARAIVAEALCQARKEFVGK